MSAEKIDLAIADIKKRMVITKDKINHLLSTRKEQEIQLETLESIKNENNE